jgi:hypothetical protein
LDLVQLDFLRKGGGAVVSSGSSKEKGSPTHDFEGTGAPALELPDIGDQMEEIIVGVVECLALGAGSTTVHPVDCWVLLDGMWQELEG